MAPVARPAARTDVILLGALYAAELGALAIALSLHRLGDRSLASSISSAPGIALAAALAILAVACAVIALRYVNGRRSGSRGFGFTVAMNLITVALIFIPLELAVRVLSRGTSDTEVFLNTALWPRSWKEAAATNLQVFDKTSGHLSYLVYDDALGWVVGKNRRGADGLYLSSAEGLRASTQGAVLRTPKTKRRVAIVGDSFVFADKVAFDESWGHQLELNSGGKLQVLNFGVGGYAIDQAYLRFQKDVMAWEPDVVILGFPFEDVLRTVTVYPFINWPEWNIPFSKPRIVRHGSSLKVLNVPTPAPTVIFAHTSIVDLPFLEYDKGYRPREWQWSFTDASYVKRLLFSVLAPWPQPSPHVSEEEMIRVNAAIFREFVRLAEDNGVVPLFAYFPGRPEMVRLMRGEPTGAQRILKQIGIPFLDTTSCVRELSLEEAYVEGDPHYSARGNAAVAKCIGAAVDKILVQRDQQRTALHPQR